MSDIGHVAAGKENRLMRWLDSPLRQPRRLAFLFTGVFVAIKLALWSFIVWEYRELQITSSGEVGSVYINTLLAPFALSHVDDTENRGLEIESAFHRIAIGHPEVVLRIWRPDGTLYFSTFGDEDAVLHDHEDLAVALAGRSVSKLETEGPSEPGFPIAFPYLEIYAPIYDPLTGELAAVGELYQDASGLLRDRAVVERIIAFSLILATLCLLGVLAISLRQAEQMRMHLMDERRMADTNRRLRAEADRARLDSAQANEQVLNLVGAELHDGPVQLLGLVSLMDREVEPQLPDGTTARALIEKVMIELRTIATGLILPELEELSPHEVVMLAVTRHQALVGEEIEAEVEPLDIALDLQRKICLFRVIQEGLTNAKRHGDGRRPRLRVTATDHAIEVRLHGQSSRTPVSEKPDLIRKLGLNGMRRRLDAFGGRAVFTRDGSDTLLHVILPTGSPNLPHTDVS